jgi:hypothetical protein
VLHVVSRSTIATQKACKSDATSIQRQHPGPHSVGPRRWKFPGIASPFYWWLGAAGVCFTELKPAGSAAAPSLTNAQRSQGVRRARQALLGNVRWWARGLASLALTMVIFSPFSKPLRG